MHQEHYQVTRLTDCLLAAGKPDSPLRKGYPDFDRGTITFTVGGWGSIVLLLTNLRILFCFQGYIVSILKKRKIHSFAIVVLFSGLAFNGLFVPSVYSQQGFSPGYVILNDGDTVYGQVKDRNLSGDRIYKRIRFRAEQGGRKKYSPGQVLGYRTGGREFDSKWFEEDARFFRFAYSCREGVGEKIFLKVLERGPLTCYFREYIDPEFGHPDGYELFQRLDEDFYERATQGILGLKKKRLSVYFADCPSLVARIRNGAIKDTLEVVEFYNSHCVDD